ncbi:MAG: Rieske (2Fe-2S) protein [Crocinitomicaceae bacterium]|nr:Rieske (2Fe-2S) protein [Crocinitomicaceae bacterium]
MLRRKLKWYALFEREEDFFHLFSDKSTVVFNAVIGQVLLVKSQDEFHAFKNKCPHQNKPLNNCSIEENHIVCPFHRYHFSVDTGQGHGTYLHKYELRFTNGIVEIGKEVWKWF